MVFILNVLNFGADQFNELTKWKLQLLSVTKSSKFSISEKCQC